MHCVAVIEAERPGLDSVIIWGDNDRLVAFAYLDGKVTMTRPLDAANLDDALREVRENFQLTAGQLTRIHDWQGNPGEVEKIAGPRRWS